MRANLQNPPQPGVDLPVTLLADDRRASQRHITVLQVAKLSTRDGEELCIVRDISSGGLKAEIYCTLIVGEAVRIAFKAGQEATGHVAWARAGEAGIAFDYSMDVADLLTRRDQDLAGNKLRPPRLKIDLPSMLRVDGDQLPVQMCDVSLDGCKLRVPAMLKPGAGCEVLLPTLGYRMAAVRWMRDGHAGIMLHERLRYPDFALWRQRLANVGL